MGKPSSHKYVDNVETESDKINLVDMSDERDLLKDMKYVKMMKKY